YSLQSMPCLKAFLIPAESGIFKWSGYTRKLSKMRKSLTNIPRKRRANSGLLCMPERLLNPLVLVYFLKPERLLI
ncbi:MAG: hypothetical protein RPR97_09890, partial [Colwellia sp.]